MLEHFLTQVGFGSVDISHNFDSWECVLWNFESGVAPLRAYRKTIQFRLLFHSIRSPKTPQKSIQPQLGSKSVLVSDWNFMQFWTPLSGTNRSGALTIRPSGFCASARFWHLSHFQLLDLILLKLEPGLGQFLAKIVISLSLKLHLLPWISSIEPRVCFSPISPSQPRPLHIMP